MENELNNQTENGNIAKRVLAAVFFVKIINLNKWNTKVNFTGKYISHTFH